MIGRSSPMHSMLVQDVVRVQGRLKAMYGARDIATPGTSFSGLRAA